MEHLCQLINMPQEVTEQVLELHKTMPMHSWLPLLMKRETWKTGLEQMKEALGEDPRGMKALCSMLRCAMMAKENFDRQGISEKIYVDTMAVFSRFVREYKESYGAYGFNRETWTTRQVSGTLLRIGQMEYETTFLDDERAISLHIPTDVDLRPEVLRPSMREAVEVFHRLFPDYADVVPYCRSWLLAPVLKEFLPETSNILRFQEIFDMVPEVFPRDSVLTWVFKNPSLPKEDYPEDTSLQRKLKKFLLDGGQFADGMGFLKATF